MTSVAYLGPPGTHTEEALLASAPGEVERHPRATLHETVMAGGMTGDTTGDTSGSMPVTTEPTMMMQPVDGIDLPAGTAVELKPGGYHIMLLDLVAPLEMGQTFTITLTFEQAGSVEVPVTVGDAAP